MPQRTIIAMVETNVKIESLSKEIEDIKKRGGWKRRSEKSKSSAGWILYLVCINVQVLLVILSYSFARRCHWVEGTWDHSGLLLKLHMNL